MNIHMYRDSKEWQTMEEAYTAASVRYDPRYPDVAQVAVVVDEESGYRIARKTDTGPFYEGWC